MNQRKPYIRHIRLTEKPLILYPAGEYGRGMLKELRRLGVEPAAFCDGSKEKIGTRIGGVRVEPLEDLLERYGTDGAKYLVNSAYNYPQIEARLVSRGVPVECILSPDFYTYCDTGVIPRPIPISEAERARLKECLLDILCFFHSVCQKYEIPYYITSGTLLGAVRHQGFIPWDDDVDVAMLRRDYNRFYRVVKGELGEKYGVQELPSRKNLGLRGSVFQSFGSEEKMMISIDTFPIDQVFAFPSRFNLFQERASITLFRLANKWGWNRKNGVQGILGGMMRGLGLGIEQLCNGFGTEWLHFFIWDTPNLYKSRVYHRELVDQKILFTFEGRQFYGPKQYDKVLRQMFGDSYMELPPAKKRVYPHTMSQLQFPKREDGAQWESERF